MKVTAIKQQQKDTNRASIFLDGLYSFSLTLDQLLDEKIKIGLTISPEELKKLKKKSSDGKIKQRTLEWLLIRPRSEKELRLYLFKKNISDDLLNSLVSEMTKFGYLSDENFARWYAELKNRQLKSNKEIVYSLRQKGVAKTIISDIMSDSIFDDTPKLEQLIASKKMLSKFKDKQKLLAFLVRKGYSFSDVKDALVEG